MAGLPGRSPGIELIVGKVKPLRRPLGWGLVLARGALAALLVLGAPGIQSMGDLEGQSVPPSAPTVTGFLHGGSVASRMGDEGALFLSGGAGIRLGGGIRVWGEGRAMTRDMEPSGSRPVLLRFGYGGVGMEWRHDGGWVEPAAAVLAGAGHTRVRSQVTGLEVASENSLVVEPSVALWSLPHPLWSAGVAGGYRWVSRVEKLPGVAPRGLRGWTLSFLVRLQQRS